VFWKTGFLFSMLEPEATSVSDKAYKELEDVFLSKRKYSASDDKPTVADLALVWHLNSSYSGGYEFSVRVKEYYELLQEYPGVKENFEKFQEDLRKFMAEMIEKMKGYRV